MVERGVEGTALVVTAARHLDAADHAVPLVAGGGAHVVEGVAGDLGGKGSLRLVGVDRREAEPHLDGRYTAFGRVVAGMDVADRLEVGDLIRRVRVWDSCMFSEFAEDFWRGLEGFRWRTSLRSWGYTLARNAANRYQRSRRRREARLVRPDRTPDRAQERRLFAPTLPGLEAQPTQP